MSSKAYTSKLEEYVEKIQIFSTSRNSYSKTDTDATFMRIKSDYMKMISFCLHTMSK